MWRTFEPDSQMKQMKIVSLQVVHFEKKFKGKSKKNSKYVAFLDSNGIPVREVFYKNGRISEELERTVRPDGKVEHLVYHISQVKAFEYFQEFNDSGKRTSYRYYRKGKLLRATKTFYNEKSNVIKSLDYEQDTIQYQSETDYYYENDTGRLMYAEMLNSKGKREYRWDYTCTDMGAATRIKMRKEARFCESKSNLANGHRQEVWTSRYQGKIRRWVTEFDSINRVVSEYFYAGKSGELLETVTTWEYSEFGISKIRLYYEGKKKRYISSNYSQYFDSNWKEQKSISTTYRKNGKLLQAYQTTYTYRNELLVLATGENLKRPQKRQWISELEYLTAPLP